MRLRGAVSPGGATALRAWCEQGLATWPAHDRRTIDTSLGTTHLTSTSGNGGRTVLWLPGTNFNAATTAPLASAVAGRVHFVVADLPGQPGLSSLEPLGRDRMARYGRWVAEVLDALDAPTVTVAGHSLGAAIALAAAPSERIDGLVLVAPAGLTEVSMTRAVLIASVPWLLRPTDDRSAAVIRLMQHDSSPVDPSVARWLTLAARSLRQVGAPGPLPHDDVARWRDERVRIMVGEADRFFPPATVRPVASERLGAEVAVIDHAGHLLPDERPQVVADVLASPW